MGEHMCILLLLGHMRCRPCDVSISTLDGDSAGGDVGEDRLRIGWLVSLEMRNA